jgi:hypothetical protein
VERRHDGVRDEAQRGGGAAAALRAGRRLARLLAHGARGVAQQERHRLQRGRAHSDFVLVQTEEALLHHEELLARVALPRRRGPQRVLRPSRLLLLPRRGGRRRAERAHAGERAEPRLEVVAFDATFGEGVHVVEERDRRREPGGERRALRQNAEEREHTLARRALVAYEVAPSLQRTHAEHRCDEAHHFLREVVRRRRRRGGGGAVVHEERQHASRELHDACFRRRRAPRVHREGEHERKKRRDGELRHLRLRHVLREARQDRELTLRPGRLGDRARDAHRVQRGGVVRVRVRARRRRRRRRRRALCRRAPPAPAEAKSELLNERGGDAHDERAARRALRRAGVLRHGVLHNVLHGVVHALQDARVRQQKNEQTKE